MDNSGGGERILGLDLGANSLGWALVSYQDGQPVGLVATGVRVFEAGVEGQIESGKDEARSAKRREARQRRRQTDRQARRMRKLAGLLQRSGLLPPGDVKGGAERHALLAKLDNELYKAFEAETAADAPLRPALTQLPYFLRARGLDERLELHAFGRALYHLAQRRGYLSNRKTPLDDDEKGKVGPAISELAGLIQKAGARTLGEYLAKVDPILERRLRKRLTARRMYEEEFDALWQAQQAYHPELLTEKLHRQVRRAIFYQRPLKSAKHLIGKCELEKGRKRAALALPEAQRFRLLQKVNDLRVHPPEGQPRPLTPEERAKLLDKLEQQEDATFGSIRTLLKLKGCEFNLERGGEKKLPGNRTAARLRKIFGARWDSLCDAERESIIDDVRSIQKESVLARRGREVWALDPEAAAAFGKVQLEKGYSALSRRALRKLLPIMEEGTAFATAKAEIYPREWQKLAVDELPSVDDAGLTLRNPAVHRALTELRKVVNAVIRKYGKPDAIRLELARDLKNPREQRKRIWENSRKRESKRKDAARLILDETGNKEPSRADIEKVLLAIESNMKCPYTGKPISIAGLVGAHPQFDVEHIIPFSRCLDDSFLNKTLCYHEENQSRKGNKTPFEAYGGDSDRWEEIVDRVKQFRGDAAKAKLERFQLRNLDPFDDFASSKLNDTRYAGREAMKYLAWLYGEAARSRVQVSPGKVTAYLRGAWNLNKILGDGGGKSRADHRHHAIDAVVIALTDRRTVAAMSKASERQLHEKGRSRGWWKLLETPWDGFLRDVQGCIDHIVVSHRVSRKIRGSLHEETFYGEAPAEDGWAYVRKPLKDLSAGDVAAIVDDHIREKVREKIEELGDVKKLEFPENHPHIEARNGRRIPIHKARLRYKRKTTAIGHGHSTRHVWTRGNSHVEVVAVLDAQGEAKQWQGAVVTRLEAHQRLRSEEPIVHRTSEPRRHFLFSLTQGDTIEVDVKTEDGEVARELYVVRGVSQEQAGRLECVHMLDARKKADIPRSGNARNRQYRPSIASLRSVNCRKVSVTPLGEVLPAND